MKNNYADACYQDQMLDLDTALELLLNSVKSITDTEEVALSDAFERVLARDIQSTSNVPPHKNSAMDGYAYQHQDGKTQYQLIGTAFAGKPYDGEVVNNECVRIMTGACVPDGANTVVMQEHVSVLGTEITIDTVPNQGSNIRGVGEDIQRGDTVFKKGRRLSPIDLGVLASVGCATVNVIRKPKVAIFCTGEELKQPGQPLGKGDIYNSNLYQLKALLQQENVDVFDFGNVGDDPRLIENTIVKTSQMADVLISTGGVSVGDADYVKPLMQKLGKIGFWKVAIKPGKPFAFGEVNGAAFFGLPGNPVSSAVTYKLLAEPALQQIKGMAESATTLTFNAIAATDFKKRPGRKDFQRGQLSKNEQGDWVVSSVNGQGSHQLLALSESDCLVELDKDSSGALKGELVSVRMV